MVDFVRRLSGLCAGFPLLLGALADETPPPLPPSTTAPPPSLPAPASSPSEAPAPAPPPPPALAAPPSASSTPPETSHEERSIPRAWYRPSTDEARPPPTSLYVPAGLLLEPQVTLGSLRGGSMTSLLLTLPLGAYAGLFGGALFADTPRFEMGFDLFRYKGIELPLSHGTTRVSMLFAFTVGAGGIFGGGVVAGDASVAPVGLRMVSEPASMMVELRAAGHLLFGGEVDSTKLATVFGVGQSAGLQLVVAPLLFKSHAENNPQSTGAAMYPSVARAEGQR